MEHPYFPRTPMEIVHLAGQGRLRHSRLVVPTFRGPGADFLECSAGGDFGKQRTVADHIVERATLPQWLGLA